MTRKVENAESTDHAPRSSVSGRVRLLTAVALIALLALMWLAVSELRARRHPNLIIVLIDTLRSDHLPSYGYERDTAPFLARLAREGVQVQGYSASSWTKPSVTTLMSGLQPQRHQTYGYEHKLPADVPYLPSILRRHGYDTGAYNSNGHLAPVLRFDRGYRIYQQPSEHGKPDAVGVTDRALEIAARLGSPFFLYVHYLDPHDPYVPERAWGRDDLSPEDYVQPRDIERGRAQATLANVDLMRDQYDGEIREMDREIERLFGGLEELGLLERTLVVITADHGEEFGERGFFAHGKTLHAESIKVPMLLWQKADLPAHRSDTPFHHVDFLPTVLEALELPLPARIELDGISQWQGILSGDGADPRPLFFHLEIDQFAELGVIAWPHKLLSRRGTTDALLFDLDQDPGELNDLVEKKERRSQLLARLLGENDALVARSVEAESTAVEGEVLESLEALGYVDSQAAE